MAEESLISKVQNLSDLELATLICLVAQEHCIIDTDPSVLDDLVQELELVRRTLLDLSTMLIYYRLQLRFSVFLIPLSIARNILL